MMDHDSQLASEYGIRVLKDQSLSEDQQTKERLERIINDAPKIGCLEALEKHGQDVKYLTDPRRSAYLDLLDVKESDDVLEIGSSLGQHTRLIAPKCHHLSALEVVLQQAIFARLWCNEENLDNVDITVGGATGELPYEDGSFDLIVCNYVLEWCAGRATIPPADHHRNFLKEAFRVLRPGGRLFLSTKNRYSIRYVLGSEDEHLGIRFGSALPRAVQNFFRRRADLGHPTGYLHSWGELERILAEAGFRSSDRILAFPDARYPDYIGPFENFRKEQLSNEQLDAIGRKNRVALKIGPRAFQATSNSLVFLAHKAEK